MTKMYRQGDILLVEVVNTKGATPLATALTHKVLAHGETTGHKHQLDGDATLFQETNTGGLFAQVGLGVRLVHDEHDTIEIPQGTYQVIRQREYDEKAIRYVSD